MTTDSTSDIPWAIEYEECELDGLWAYKLDHEPIKDGEWHALNAKASARYRISGELCQYAAPDKQTPPAEFDAALKAFASAGRLAERGVVEVRFRKRAAGYELYSHWLLHHPGVMLPELHPKLLPQAYRDLLALERQADSEE